MWKLLAPAALLAGCLPSPPPTWQTYGAPPQQAEEAGAAPVAGRSCVEIVQCLAGCGEDTACFPACVASGDEAGQASVNALLACNAAGTGPCDAELDACRGGSVVAAAPAAPMAPGQPHSTADLVPWLTGEWIGSRHQFVFHGDGRVRRSDAVGLAYRDPGERSYDNRCVSVVNDEGTVTQEGDLLIMRFEATSTNHCGERSVAAGVTVRYRIDWVDNAYDDDPYLQLVLRDIDCTAGSMWCDDAMTRR